MHDASVPSKQEPVRAVNCGVAATIPPAGRASKAKRPAANRDLEDENVTFGGSLTSGDGVLKQV
jgi:hypothetical protein